MKAGDTIRLMFNRRDLSRGGGGTFPSRQAKSASSLAAGEVGYIIAGVKTVSDVHTGDTITLNNRPCAAPLPGFKEVKPVVFASIYPIASDDYEDLADSLEKYKLNDASFIYEKDSSVALGQGFRCGFLGLLHLEIVQERLEREYDLSIILSVTERPLPLHAEGWDVLEVDNPANYPDPIIDCQVRRALHPGHHDAPGEIPGRGHETVHGKEREAIPSCSYLGPGRVELTYEMPLAEVIYDFYDRFKSVTQGYGSFDYDVIDYRESNLVLLDILVNGEKVDALSQIVHRDRARARGVQACDRLKEEIPRQMFKIAIQGAIGGEIISRSTISPFRKDVTAKCYGGDISRKRKLLEKQKKGKKRMKMIGSVSIPQSAFLAVLKSDSD